MGKLDKLQPAAVWKIFEAMNQIPRGSGNETGVMNMLKGWADERGLAWKQDAVGNLLITIPATRGLEKAEPVLVQGHVDMVCEKNAATKHDFEKDPLKLKVNGDWVTAEGTTLGADNAIGCAMGLALADEKTPHGPVEVLLTVDEERGLTGAAECLHRATGDNMGMLATVINGLALQDGLLCKNHEPMLLSAFSWRCGFTRTKPIMRSGALAIDSTRKRHPAMASMVSAYSLLQKNHFLGHTEAV